MFDTSICRLIAFCSGMTYTSDPPGKLVEFFADETAYSTPCATGNMLAMHFRVLRLVVIKSWSSSRVLAHL